MHKRFINGDSFSWIEEKSTRIKRFVDFKKGYISQLKISKVKYKIEIDNLCRADNGDEWYIFLPDDENWCLTIMYDINKQVIQWYFDITYKNCISDQGIPFHYDLYLDIVVYPDSSIVLLDEDDLSAALENKEITQEIYDQAYNVRKQILKSQLVDVGFLSALSDRIKESFI